MDHDWQMPPLDDLHRLQEDQVQAARKKGEENQSKIKEAATIDRNIIDGQRIKGKGMMIERHESTNGNVRWSMPSWFANLLIWALTTWAVAVTGTVVYCYAQLSVGGRFTAQQGEAFDQRIYRLETSLPPSWLVNQVEELKQTTKENKKLIEQNHDLLINLSARTGVQP